MSSVEEGGVSSLVQLMCSNEDVLFHWTFLGIDNEPRTIRACGEIMDYRTGFFFVQSIIALNL